jgi:hypothetical protein
MLAERKSDLCGIINIAVGQSADGGTAKKLFADGSYRPMLIKMLL